MNRTKLKAYAPKARREFINAVTDRAAYYGLTKGRIETINEKGDVAIIAGKAFPRVIVTKRKRLEERIGQQGFDQVMEAMAFTWFNRFAAVRFMELHGYLDHGYRVLSHPEGKATPEIVEHAEHVDLPGLDREKVIELKIEGTREVELYGMILIAQCNALHKAMPFLFEKIDDETELLLPENLLHSDSLIRKLVNEIPEEEWKDIEIIGWLYQFYISEKKDQVIGKVVKSEDIPAATQLFTPNWIVKYMVQNTLGRQWLATYPDSQLKSKMEYYIEPAEQTPEVLEQLKAITPKNLNPEELTFLDPATGSGHILVEAYDLFKAIYQERGYRAKDIPRLILEKNLFGLEIDDRAAQLAAFALMMKTRADDRRIFDSNVQPRVLAIQESKGLDANKITEALNAPILKTKLPPSEMLFEEMEEAKAPLFSRKNLSIKGEISQDDVSKLIGLFEHGKTFGSLIRVPEELAEKLPGIAERVKDVLTYGEMFGQGAARAILPLIEQICFLSNNYYSIVANPPYMGSSFFNETLKNYVNKNFSRSKNDICAVFVERFLHNLTSLGSLAFITIPAWLFISGFDEFRAHLIENYSIQSLIDIGRGLWGSDYGSCSFVINRNKIGQMTGVYKKLFDQQSEVNSEDELRQRFFSRKPYFCSSDDFLLLPGTPFSYWTSKSVRSIYLNNKALADYYKPKAGISTGKNESSIAYWYEVDFALIKFNSEPTKDIKYFPHNKAGGFRRWYGLHDYVIRYSPKDVERMEGYPGFRHDNKDYYLKSSVSWGKVTIGLFSARYYPPGFVFDSAAISIFPDRKQIYLGFLNSNVFNKLLSAISRSMNFTVGDISKIPIKNEALNENIIIRIVNDLLIISKADSALFETSFDFQSFPCLSSSLKSTSLANSWQKWDNHCKAQIRRMQELETENNRLFIEAYGLKEELDSEVPEDQTTLYRPTYEEDIKKLISYTIGCMMGRYSLDKPGLIYALSGNDGFDPSQYQTFPADEDGIVPLTEIEWFEKDAANRFVEFIGVAWPKEHLEENLTFVAESLGSNQGESPHETIRRYLATGFFKHHLSMYKKRPIYWLFSSGRQRAFQCLVYLHRYNEGTLSRMRTDYVIPLQGKMSARLDQLAGDITITTATATSHRKKLEKEKDKLGKQLAELRTFDEKLRHYADLRISLDLDDGVKVNYGKFGDLLAEVKVVTGNGE